MSVEAQSVSRERIATGSGVNLVVERRAQAGQIELVLRAQTPKRCVLHWGLRSATRAGWRSLPPALWPAGTTAAGADAMQTPFTRKNGEACISIALAPAALEFLEFVLFFPEEGRWDDNGRRNYQISVSSPSPAGGAPLEALQQQLGSAEVLLERAFELESAGQLAVGVSRAGENYRLLFLSDVPGPLALHWGIARRSPYEWLQPAESLRPAGTVLWEGHTAHTPFQFSGGWNRLELAFPGPEAPLGIQFVLWQGPAGRWLKQRGGNFYIAVHTPARQPAGQPAAGLAELGQRIIQAEMGPSSWTLMHRFNLCFDLLERARSNPEALALLYVWLRFSALRQLTWQRHYNTKPRELAHAQDRLTQRLAECYGSEPHGRSLVRLMLATLGRGGDGQRIRDEILQIMHRHHVKEVSGHFLEEWHQKLHNNTTPDDIVICEAYLEFLRSEGNLERYYHILRQGGVTRERLESFERPIRTHPDFVSHLKGALIGEFENFLKILKAVHSATDLETALQAARDRLDGETQGRLAQVWNQVHGPPEGLVGLVQQITEVRRRLSALLQSGEGLRPLLYLDLALEQLIRVVVERNLHQHLSGAQLTSLIGCVLENVTLTYEEPELAACLRHWERLARTPAEETFTPLWSLHAKSVTDRIGRALADWTDRFYQLLQPNAEFLGKGFNAESWSIALFSEEVVRGSSLGFVLSMLVHQLGRRLRQAANLGPWQIVSPGRGTGVVEVVEALRSVQGKPLAQPTVVVADKVMGDEELPEAVVAVIAPDVTDLVSHVAVRARNARVLFAACVEPKLLEELRALRGRRLHLEVTAAGDVVFAEAAQPEAGTSLSLPQARLLSLVRPRFSRFAVSAEEFNERLVGGKSNAQVRLRGKLPDWIHQPASLALPFGVFEQVLSHAANRQAAQRCNELAKSLSESLESPGHGSSRRKEAEMSSAVAEERSLLTSAATLSKHAQSAGQLREAVLSLTAPEELKAALREAFGRAEVAWPGDWELAWRRIKEVWASKWNERAVLSRQRLGVRDEDLCMAVLIQPVVEADYAFVIHTVNPSSGNRDELYAEVVLGLGETLVGNYPGRALSFVWDKRAQQAHLLSFPSKSVALRGAGLIFRSDSNGEDLAGYAGAGLYDSVLLQQPRQMLLDYSDDRLLWDEAFRNGLLRAIANLGLAIEGVLGAPQDIEGAVAKGEYFVVQSRPQVGLSHG